MYVLMGNMKFYIINFNSRTLSLEAEVEGADINSIEIYERLCEILGCESIEFIDFNDEIVMIVDELGKFKKMNPIFKVKTDYGEYVELAGKILFARNIYNEFSTDIGSIKYEDIFNLRLNLDIQLLGMTSKK